MSDALAGEGPDALRKVLLREARLVRRIVVQFDIRPLGRVGHAVEVPDRTVRINGVHGRLILRVRIFHCPERIAVLGRRRQVACREDAARGVLVHRRRDVIPVFGLQVRRAERTLLEQVVHGRDAVRDVGRENENFGRSRTGPQAAVRVASGLQGVLGLHQHVLARYDVSVERQPVAGAVHVHAAARSEFGLLHDVDLAAVAGAVLERDFGSHDVELGTHVGPGRRAGGRIAVLAGGVEGIDRALVDADRTLVAAARNRHFVGVFLCRVIVVAEYELPLFVVERIGRRIAREQDIHRLAGLAFRGRQLRYPRGLRVEAPLEIGRDPDGIAQAALSLGRPFEVDDGRRGVGRRLLVGELAVAVGREVAAFVLLAQVEVERALHLAAGHRGDHLGLAAHRHRNVDAAVRVVLLLVGDADDDFVFAGLAAHGVGGHAVVVDPEPFAGLVLVYAYRPVLIRLYGNRTSPSDFDAESGLFRKVRSRNLFPRFLVGTRTRRKPRTC